MHPSLVEVAVALVATMSLVAALRRAALPLGLVDRPGGRKLHSGDVPVVGGLAMAAALVATVPALRELSTEDAWFVAALAILVGVGVIDDRRGLSPRVRLVAQAVAGLAMVAGAGVVLRELGLDGLGVGVVPDSVGVPLTLLVVLGAVNAFNMFDGSDGVAGAQALVGLAFLAGACLAADAPVPAPLAALAGCIAGFLVFNWPSARTRGVRVFMGDAGSTMLGFSLAWLSVEASQRERPVIDAAVALWLFALPLFDMLSAVWRRVRAGQSPFAADAEHFHHVLRRAGLTPRGVALVVVAASAGLATVGVGAHAAGVDGAVLAVAWLALAGAFHYVFGSGRVFRRRAQLRAAFEAHAPAVGTPEVRRTGPAAARRTARARARYGRARPSALRTTSPAPRRTDRPPSSE